MVSGYVTELILGVYDDGIGASREELFRPSLGCCIGLELWEDLASTLMWYDDMTLNAHLCLECWNKVV